MYDIHRTCSNSFNYFMYLVFIVVKIYSFKLCFIFVFDSYCKSFIFNKLVNSEKDIYKKIILKLTN